MLGSYYWSNTFVITPSVNTISLNDSYYIIFANVVACNGTIILPSSVGPSKGYEIRKIDTSSNKLTITTDNANCKINGVANIVLTSIQDSANFVMGYDKNYYASVPGLYLGGVPSYEYVTNTQLQANVSTVLSYQYVTNAQLQANLTGLYNNIMSHINSSCIV